MKDLKEIENWTIEDFKEAHRELWMTISELPYEILEMHDTAYIKRVALEKLQIKDGYVEYNCFVCEVVNRLPQYGCRKYNACPAVWTKDGGHCLSVSSPYRHFDESVTVGQQRKYAREIANIPFKRVTVEII